MSILYLTDNLEIEYYENFNLTSIVTPLQVEKYAALLKEVNYDPVETDFLIDGFTNGFDISYRGEQIRQSSSSNIPFSVGNK